MRIPVKSKTSICHSNKNFEENVLNYQKCLFLNSFLMHLFFAVLLRWRWMCGGIVLDRWLLVNTGLFLWIHSPCLPGWQEWGGTKRWERKDPWSQGVGKANYALREAEGDKWKSSINASCHYQSICSGWCIKSPANLCLAGVRCTPTMAYGLTYEERSLKRNPYRLREQPSDDGDSNIRSYSNSCHNWTITGISTQTAMVWLMWLWCQMSPVVFLFQRVEKCFCCCIKLREEY